MPARAELIRRRLGGRWAVSWQGYLLLLPLSVPLSLLVVPAYFSPTAWPAGLLTATVAYVAAGAVLYAASLTVLRNRRMHPVPVVVVVVVGGLAWMARSAVFALLLSALGEYVDTSVGERLAVGFVLGGLLVPGAAWLLAVLDDFRTERRLLIDELARQELAAERSEVYIAVMRDELLASVESQIHSVAATAELDDADAQPASGAAGEKLLALETAVGRISKDLARDVTAEAAAQTRITLRTVLELASRRPFSLWPIPAYVVLGVLLVRRFEPLTGTLVAFGVAGLWATAVALVANAAGRRSAHPSIPLYVAFVGLLSASGAVSALVLDVSGIPHGSDVQLMITVSVPFALLMVAGGLARAVNVAEEEVLNEVRTSISYAEVRAQALLREESRLRRDVATHLHGTVAANVTAATMRLRHAIDEGDVVAAQAALVEASQLLQSNLRETLLVERSDLVGLLDELATSWIGIVDIAVTVAAPVGPSPHLIRDICDVVTEAVSNAVRHADARHIHVDIELAAHLATVTVTDDGSPRQPSPPGLGTTLFDELAPHNWARTEHQSGGSTLVVRLPH